MGGCKCAFRDCTNSSNNKPDMHFFHFPVKNPEKFKLWTKYANAEYILKLEKNQAINKKVCSVHFRDECFMNYKKNRLIKGSVPTLSLLYEDCEGKVVLDYETSDYPEPVRISPPTAKHLVPPISEKRKAEENGENIVSTKMKKIEENVVFVNLNKTLKDRKQAKANFKETDTLNEENIEIIVPKTVTYNLELDNSLCRIEEETLYKEAEECIEREVDEYEKDQIISIENVEINDGQVIKESSEYVRKDELQNEIERIEKVYETKLKKLEYDLKLKNSEILELKNNLSKSNYSSKSNNSISLNKEQLFHSIKKYLCPSMSSLVRMEMFGHPEREWKSDEKEIATELLNLGESVFCYFRDEWRFRLPPQKDVEQWLKES